MAAAGTPPKGAAPGVRICRSAGAAAPPTATRYGTCNALTGASPLMRKSYSAVSPSTAPAGPCSDRMKSALALISTTAKKSPDSAVAAPSAPVRRTAKSSSASLRPSRNTGMVMVAVELTPASTRTRSAGKNMSSGVVVPGAPMSCGCAEPDTPTPVML